MAEATVRVRLCVAIGDGEPVEFATGTVPIALSMSASGTVATFRWADGLAVALRETADRIEAR